MKVISPENVIYTLNLSLEGREDEINLRAARKYFYKELFYGMKPSDN